MQRKFRHVFCREYFFAKGNVKIAQEYTGKVSKLRHLVTWLFFFFSKESPSTMIDGRFSSAKFSFATLLKITCSCYECDGMPTGFGGISAACRAPLHWQNEGHLSHSPWYWCGSVHDYDVDLHGCGKCVFLTSNALLTSLSAISSMRLFYLPCSVPKGKK